MTGKMLVIQPEPHFCYPCLRLGNRADLGSARPSLDITAKTDPSRGLVFAMEAPRFELGSADAVRGCLQV
jgi:hypothetical protein